MIAPIGKTPAGIIRRPSISKFESWLISGIIMVLSWFSLVTSISCGLGSASTSLVPESGVKLSDLVGFFVLVGIGGSEDGGEIVDNLEVDGEDEIAAVTLLEGEWEIEIVGVTELEQLAAALLQGEQSPNSEVASPKDTMAGFRLEG